MKELRGQRSEVRRQTTEDPSEIVAAGAPVEQAKPFHGVKISRGKQMTEGRT